VELPVPAVSAHAVPLPRPGHVSRGGRRPPEPGVGRERSEPVRVRLSGRTLLLVAGMPGAGKSTLIAGLPPRPGVRVLDSDVQRVALARRLPGLPYGRYRPLVHLLHRLALARAACSDVRTVVVHLPATAASTRTAIVVLAALTGRAAHLLWLHADPGAALGGQRERGRVVPSGSFAGHARRAAATYRRLRHGRPGGFRGVTLLDRPTARAGLVLDTRVPSPAGSPTPEPADVRAEGHRPTATVR
jgi:predicted kinase